jgi:predicted transcriptional regulator of viral defense system
MNKEIQNHPLAGVQLIKALAEKGCRIFTTKDALIVGQSLGLKKAYINLALFYLKKNNWIDFIKNGLYSLSPIFLSETPVHEYEIAMHLAKSIYVSHFSAFHYHGLTDQLPKEIYTTVQTNSTFPRSSQHKKFSVFGIPYHFSQVKKEHFFGFKSAWIGPVRIHISDLERTLLDGLIKPQFCGGIQEVLNAYKNHINRVNVKALLDYGSILDASVAKRLGWILEKINPDQDLSILKEIPFKGFIKLDISAPKEGIYNKHWQIVENL